MRVLGYIGTYNEDASRALSALQRQTRPLDGIVIVDNASTETVPDIGTIPGVTVVRNAANLGPSGAITTGMRHALEHGYEWIWIFDADSVPAPHALERLLALYRELGADDSVGLLGCTPVLRPGEESIVARRFTPGGPRPPSVAKTARWYECDANIWSGSLIRVSAVCTVGMPRCGQAGFWDDLGHDYGDFEYSHRLRSAGYRIVVDRESTMEHGLGDAKFVSLLGRTVFTTNHPAGRRYLYFRNLTYFWFKIYPRRGLWSIHVWLTYRLLSTVLKIALFEDDSLRKVHACLKGTRHGLACRMHQPF